MVGAAPLIVGVVASEAAATLFLAVAGNPILGLCYVAVGISIALAWLRRYRREADAIVGAQIAAANILLEEGRRTAAWNAACAAAHAAAGVRRIHAAVAALVRIALDEKNYRLARQVWEQARRRGILDPCLEATIEHSDGRTDDAIEILERAREGAAFDGGAARLLVELYAETNDLTRAVRVAIDCVNLLPAQDLRNMIASLQAWGEPGHAAALTLAVALRKAIAARDVRPSDASDRLAAR